MRSAAILLKISMHCFITLSIPSNVLLTSAILLLSSSSAFPIFSIFFQIEVFLSTLKQLSVRTYTCSELFVTTVFEKFSSLFVVTWSFDCCWAYTHFVDRRILKCCFSVWFCKIILIPNWALELALSCDTEELPFPE